MHRAHNRDKEWEAHCQEVHLKKLKSMKPAIDNQAPETFSHLISQRKRIQMESDRLSKIETENAMLLEKMAEIMTKPTQIDHNNPNIYKKSMNREARQREAEKINQENYAFAKRTIENPPQYSRTHWTEEQEKQIRYLANRTQFPVLDHHKKIGLVKKRQAGPQEELRKAKLAELLNSPKPQRLPRDKPDKSPNTDKAGSGNPDASGKIHKKKARDEDAGSTVSDDFDLSDSDEEGEEEAEDQE